MAGVGTVVTLVGTTMVGILPTVGSAWLAKLWSKLPPLNRKARRGGPIIASNKDIQIQINRKVRSAFAALDLRFRFHNAINVSIIAFNPLQSYPWIVSLLAS